MTGPSAGWRQWTDGALWAMMVAYALFFGTLVVLQHNAFQTTAFDLGNVDQAVWNTIHGRPFAMTNIEGLTNRLGTHVEPILLPVSLLYLVWSDPRALLLLQTVVIALGAWPVHRLAWRALSGQDRAPGAASQGVFAEEVLPLLFAAVYLLMPALQSANLFDFHAVALAPTFFLLAFYCLETRRWGGYALFALLTMSCKEDMPLLVAMLGLYALVVRRERVVGLATVGVAGAWFLAAVGWIMPHFDTRGVSPLANRYAYLGDGPLEMGLTLLTRPGVAWEQFAAAGGPTYLRDLLAPVAFLSLLAPQVLALALPPLLVNLLSTDGFMHQLQGFHYGVTLVPAVVVSAAYGAGWLLRRFRGARWLPIGVAAVLAATSLIYHVGHGYTPLAADFAGTWPTVTDHHRLGEAMARDIDPEAPLAALPYLNPHASQRQQLSMIDRVENGLPAPLWEDGYVWLDVTNGWPLHPNDLKAGVENLLAGEYGVVGAEDGWLLLRHGAADKVLPDAFYDFARAVEPQPQHPMRLQFLLEGEPILECLGYDLAFDAGESAYEWTLYWRALRSLPPGLRLYPFYMDDATGQILEDTTLRPMIATVWVPPEQWQTTDTVVTRTLPWPVGPTFSLGLGVMQGADWQAVDQRLPIRVESSEPVIRLFEGDTWARLSHVEEYELVEENRLWEAPDIEHKLDADLGGKVRLLGYDGDCRIEDGACSVTLYWQAQARLDTSYTVFAQLLDPAGRVRAQVDAAPQAGGYPTIWWLPGEVVVDPVSLALPADAPRDVPYRLIVGLYDAQTGARLPLAGADRDSIELAMFEP